MKFTDSMILKLKQLPPKEREFIKKWADLSTQKQALLWQLGAALHGDDEKARERALDLMVRSINRTPEDLVSQDVATLAVARTSRRKKYIAKFVRQQRLALGLSQKELADLAGMDQAHISKIEGGWFASTHKTIAKLAGALKVRVKDIDPSQQDVGEAVARIRKEKKIGRAVLSERIGLRLRRLEAIENGKIPTPEEILSLASGLNIRVEELDPTIMF